MEPLISPLLDTDWPQVRAIYLQGIATGLATFETHAPDWERWNAAHHPFARLVARAEDRLLGWAAVSPVSARAAYAGVADVSIYVAEEARGKGVGRALLAALIPAAEANGIWTLQSSIFAENRASLALHLGGGFRLVGRREHIAQLHGVWHDTLLLERRSEVVGR